MNQPLEALRAAVNGPAWLVGGTVRDELLGRPSPDLDVVVAQEARGVASDVAARTRAAHFELSERFGAWRVVARDRSWQLDVMPLEGATIEEDLGRRDLTVNAMARAVDGGELIDPWGGRRDLGERSLRIVAPDALHRDPLRALRIARLAGELGFEPVGATRAAAREVAPRLSEVAVERVFVELRRLVVCPRAIRGLELLDELGLTAVVLPEVARLEGVTQSEFHHLDVLGHTRAVLGETIALVADPEPVFGGRAQEVCQVLAEPLGSDLDRGQALRLGALLHDIAKPQTRAVNDGGRVTFFGHDAVGAELAAGILRRLRAAERVAVHTGELVRHHLRLGFLVHDAPLSRDAAYGYLSTCEPVEVDVTVLSVADRLATRGRNAERAIERHVELARSIIGDALAWHRERPRPPVGGDELIRDLGLAPGPELGRVLAMLEREAYAGRVAGRTEALARARELIAAR